MWTIEQLNKSICNEKKHGEIINIAIINTDIDTNKLVYNKITIPP